MTRKLLDDCFLHDKDRLRHDQALAILAARVAPVVAKERVALADVAGRALAGSIVASRPIPAHTNAAVDGYAFAAAAYDRAKGATLTVAGRAAAGHPLTGAADPKAAVRIFTGAVLPAGLDTCIMQEDATVADGAVGPVVTLPPGLKTGANVRKAGEDVKAGETLFVEGHVVRPQDVAALASLGLAAVECFAPLDVAVVSTGDEVIRPGAGHLALGQVYDANAPMIAALARATGAGARVHDLGVWPDDGGEVRARLAEAARTHHVVITSGGASRGEEDHMVLALDALGKRHMWQLAIKPGRPMSFGQIGDTVVVGLPGNPVAVFVCFLLYVRPLLRRLAGAPWSTPRRWRLPAAFDFKGRKTGRREFWRGILKEGPDGLVVDKFARDGSGLISGLRAADGLIDIPEEAGDVKAGDLVDFIPFGELGIAG